MQANKEFDKKNYPTAKTYYDQLLDIEPNNIDFLERRGYCNQVLGKYDNAIIDLSKAIKLDSKRASFYVFRGNNFAFVEKYNESIIDYNKAIRLKPNLKGVYNNLGMSYLNTNNKEKACECFLKGERLGDKNAKKNYTRYCK